MFGALLALVPAGTARAVTIEVTTTADEAPVLEGGQAAAGPRSLRAAIDQTNLESVPAVIVLPEGVYELSRCGGDEDGNVSEDLDHLGDQDLSIVGEGAGATIRSTCADRVLDQHGTGLLTLANVTITGGVVGGDGRRGNAVLSGGGVRAEGSVLLDHAVVDGNTVQGAIGPVGANGGDALGAGLWVGGSLTATNSSITNNRARGGDAGACNPDLTHGGDALGGGAYVMSEVVVYQSVVADNAVLSNNGPRCPISWYDTGTGRAIGGGIYGGAWVGAPVAIDQSRVANNQALFDPYYWYQYPRSSGDMAAGGVAALSTLHITDSTFDANIVDTYYGAVRGSAAWSAGPMSVERSTLTANRIRASEIKEVVVGDGATLASARSVTATNVTFRANEVSAFQAAEPVTVSSPAIDLLHVTVDGDTGASMYEGDPAGALFSADTMTMRASVLHPVAASMSLGCSATGMYSSGGDNWATDASCGLTDPSDVVVAGGDPLLGAIADNGGPTRTLLPQPGSPLIDAVPVGRCAVANDQRDAPRPAGPGCDVGAVEADGVVPPTTTTSTTTTTIPPTTSTTIPTTSTSTSTSTTTSTSIPTTTTTSTTSTTSIPTTTTTTTPPPTGSRFHPRAPVRVLDSRSSTGWTGKVAAGAPRALKVTGVRDVPAGADAVVLNVTVTGGNANSFLTAYPSGTTVPRTSNLNFAEGQTTANLVTVKVGADGKVAFANALGAVDVVADLVGFYDPSAAGGDRYNAVTPVRALDSRTGAGWSGPLVQGAPRALQVAGTTGVPASADAVVLNVTATGGSANSFLTVYPEGGSVPNASNLNFSAGETIPNLVTVKLGAGGKVSFANAVGAVDVVADLVGYFDANTGDSFHVLAPTRALDSRTGAGWSGALAQGVPRSLQVAGANGIPPDAHAVLANLTATAGTANSFVTVYPAGAPMPSASTLNFAAGQTIPNLAAVRLGDGGRATFANAQGSVHLIADLVGYYA